MRCRVTLLRAKGVLLKRSQLPEPVEGDLVVCDWGPPTSRNWTRRAELLGRLYGGCRLEVLLPIFEVQIAKIDETGLYLTGYERGADPESGDLAEYRQIWRCELLQAAD